MGYLRRGSNFKINMLWEDDGYEWRTDWLQVKLWCFVVLSVINISVMIVITWFIQASWLPCTNIKITSKHFTLITKSKERIYDFIGSHNNDMTSTYHVTYSYFTYFLYCAGCSLPHLVCETSFIYLLLKVHLYKKLGRSWNFRLLQNFQIIITLPKNNPDGQTWHQVRFIQLRNVHVLIFRPFSGGCGRGHLMDSCIVDRLCSY